MLRDNSIYILCPGDGLGVSNYPVHTGQTFSSLSFVKEGSSFPQALTMNSYGCP